MGYDDQMNEKHDDITHLGVVSDPKKRVILPNSVIRHGQDDRNGALVVGWVVGWSFQSQSLVSALERMAGTTRLELATSAVTARRLKASSGTLIAP